MHFAAGTGGKEKIKKGTDQEKEGKEQKGCEINAAVTILVSIQKIVLGGPPCNSGPTKN